MDILGTWYKTPLPNGLLGYLKIDYAKLSAGDTSWFHKVHGLLEYEEDINNYDIVNADFEIFLNDLQHGVCLHEEPCAANVFNMCIMFENINDMMEFQLRFA